MILHITHPRAGHNRPVTHDGDPPVLASPLILQYAGLMKNVVDAALKVKTPEALGC